MHELPSAFAGKSVFVTGHTGFKGAWLALWLSRLGARVTGYALAPPTQPSTFEPRETFDVNVIGTASVLDAVRALERPCVVIVITSDKCYENREQVFGYRETDPMGGFDPYSASKGAAEIVVSSYRQSFFPAEREASHGVRLASVRAGNVIGGGDWAQDRIVADIARSLSADQPVPVRNPRAIRPWQHVLEPLGGYLLLAARMLAGSDGARLAEAWNFGPSSVEVVTVGELVDLFVSAWGSGSWKDTSTPGQVHEAHLLRLSIDKAVTLLGWRPRWAVRETVRRTATWYRTFYERREAERMPGFMRESCLGDIANYQSS